MTRIGRPPGLCWQVGVVPDGKVVLWFLTVVWKLGCRHWVWAGKVRNWLRLEVVSGHITHAPYKLVWGIPRYLMNCSDTLGNNSLAERCFSFSFFQLELLCFLIKRTRKYKARFKITGEQHVRWQENDFRGDGTLISLTKLHSGTLPTLIWQSKEGGVHVKIPWEIGRMV